MLIIPLTYMFWLSVLAPGKVAQPGCQILEGYSIDADLLLIVGWKEPIRLPGANRISFRLERHRDYTSSSICCSDARQVFELIGDLGDREEPVNDDIAYVDVWILAFCSTQSIMPKMFQMNIEQLMDGRYTNLFYVFLELSLDGAIVASIMDPLSTSNISKSRCSTCVASWSQSVVRPSSNFKL